MSRVRIRVSELDREDPTELNVGPAGKFEHGLKFIVEPCWLVQFKGPGYVDYYRCYSRQLVRAVVRHFQSCYPNIKVNYLVEFKDEPAS